MRERGKPPRLSAVDNQRDDFCETTRKTNKQTKTKHEILGGRSHGQRKCVFLVVSYYAQEKKNTLHTWKITYPSIFLPCRNSLQFCCIPWITRGNKQASSEQATSPRHVFPWASLQQGDERSGAGWHEAERPEGEDWVNRAKQKQRGE